VVWEGSQGFTDVGLLLLLLFFKRSLGLKTKAKIKYHSWLEVRIFISGNERFQSENRIEALNKN